MVETVNIKILTRLYNDAVKYRVASSNRMGLKEEDDVDISDKLDKMFDEIKNDLPEVYIKYTNDDGSLNKFKLHKAVLKAKEAVGTKKASPLFKYKDRIKKVEQPTETFRSTCGLAIKSYKNIEELLALHLEAALNNEYPSIGKWLQSIDGIGPVHAAQICAFIGGNDIYLPSNMVKGKFNHEAYLGNRSRRGIARFDNISSLWRYAGLGMMDVCETCEKEYIVPNKKAQKESKLYVRLRMANDKTGSKGRKSATDEELRAKAHNMICQCSNPKVSHKIQRNLKEALPSYSKDFKALCWRISEQFVKLPNSYYGKMLVEKKAEYEVREDLRKELEGKAKKVSGVDRFGNEYVSTGRAHIHNMAKRYVQKELLKDIWVFWRKDAHLSVTDPYVVAHMGHTQRNRSVDNVISKEEYFDGMMEAEDFDTED